MSSRGVLADDVKKPDYTPSLDPHNFPGHRGTTVPLLRHAALPQTGANPRYGEWGPRHPQKI